mgnify:CR=1 FL=1
MYTYLYVCVSTSTAYIVGLQHFGIAIFNTNLFAFDRVNNFHKGYDVEP